MDFVVIFGLLVVWFHGSGKGDPGGESFLNVDNVPGTMSDYELAFESSLCSQDAARDVADTPVNPLKLITAFKKKNWQVEVNHCNSTCVYNMHIYFFLFVHTFCFIFFGSNGFNVFFQRLCPLI